MRNKISDDIRNALNGNLTINNGNGDFEVKIPAAINGKNNFHHAIFIDEFIDASNKIVKPDIKAPLELKLLQNAAQGIAKLAAFKQNSNHEIHNFNNRTIIQIDNAKSIADPKTRLNRIRNLTNSQNQYWSQRFNKQNPVNNYAATRAYEEQLLSEYIKELQSTFPAPKFTNSTLEKFGRIYLDLAESNTFYHTEDLNKVYESFKLDSDVINSYYLDNYGSTSPKVIGHQILMDNIDVISGSPVVKKANIDFKSMARDIELVEGNTRDANKNIFKGHQHRLDPKKSKSGFVTPYLQVENEANYPNLVSVRVMAGVFRGGRGNKSTSGASIGDQEKVLEGNLLGHYNSWLKDNTSTYTIEKQKEKEIRLANQTEAIEQHIRESEAKSHQNYLESVEIFNQDKDDFLKNGFPIYDESQLSNTYIDKKGITDLFMKYVASDSSRVRITQYKNYIDNCVAIHLSDNLLTKNLPESAMQGLQYLLPEKIEVQEDSTNKIYSMPRNHKEKSLFPIGNPDKASAFIVGEGLANGIIAHDGFVRHGYEVCTLCAMDVGNIRSAIQIISNLYPEKPIINMADNDLFRKKTGEERTLENNTGLRNAEQMKDQIGLPYFTIDFDALGLKDEQQKMRGSDIDDLTNIIGREKAQNYVVQQFENAMKLNVYSSFSQANQHKVKFLLTTNPDVPNNFHGFNDLIESSHADFKSRNGIAYETVAEMQRNVTPIVSNSSINELDTPRTKPNVISEVEDNTDLYVTYDDIPKTISDLPQPSSTRFTKQEIESITEVFNTLDNEIQSVNQSIVPNPDQATIDKLGELSGQRKQLYDQYKDVVSIPSKSINTEKSPTLNHKILSNSDYEKLIMLAIEKGERWQEAEPLILSSPVHAYQYARNILHRKWPEAEEVISKSPIASFLYARDIVKQPWPLGEKAILQDPMLSVKYARDLIEGTWPNAEKIIASNPESAFWYSHEVIKGLWPSGEPIIKESSKWAQMYAMNVIGKPWEGAEEIILTSPESAYSYFEEFYSYEMYDHEASDFYQDDVFDIQYNRWVDAEGLFKSTSATALMYLNKVRPQSFNDLELNEFKQAILKNSSVALDAVKAGLLTVDDDVKMVISSDEELRGEFEYFLESNPNPNEFRVTKSINDRELLPKSDVQLHDDFRIACLNGNKAIQFMNDNKLNHRIPAFEQSILKNPQSAFNYTYKIYKSAKQVLPEFESVIASNPLTAFNYATSILRKPWQEGEAAILTDPSIAAAYSIHVKNERWPEAESIIKTNIKAFEEYQQHFDMAQDQSIMFNDESLISSTNDPHTNLSELLNENIPTASAFDESTSLKNTLTQGLFDDPDMMEYLNQTDDQDEVSEFICEQPSSKSFTPFEIQKVKDRINKIDSQIDILANDDIDEFSAQFIDSLSKTREAFHKNFLEMVDATPQLELDSNNNLQLKSVPEEITSNHESPKPEDKSLDLASTSIPTNESEAVATNTEQPETAPMAESVDAEAQQSVNEPEPEVVDADTQQPETAPEAETVEAEAQQEANEPEPEAVAADADLPVTAPVAETVDAEVQQSANEPEPDDVAADTQQEANEPEPEAVATDAELPVTAPEPEAVDAETQQPETAPEAETVKAEVQQSANEPEPEAIAADAEQPETAPEAETVDAEAQQEANEPEPDDVAADTQQPESAPEPEAVDAETQQPETAPEAETVDAEVQQSANEPEPEAIAADAEQPETAPEAETVDADTQQPETVPEGETVDAEAQQSVNEPEPEAIAADAEQPETAPEAETVDAEVQQSANEPEPEAIAADAEQPETAPVAETIDADTQQPETAPEAETVDAEAQQEANEPEPEAIAADAEQPETAPEAETVDAEVQQSANEPEPEAIAADAEQPETAPVAETIDADTQQPETAPEAETVDAEAQQEANEPEPDDVAADTQQEANEPEPEAVDAETQQPETAPEAETVDAEVQQSANEPEPEAIAADAEQPETAPEAETVDADTQQPETVPEGETVDAEAQQSVNEPEPEAIAADTQQPESAPEPEAVDAETQQPETAPEAETVDAEVQQSANEPEPEAIAADAEQPETAPEAETVDAEAQQSVNEPEPEAIAADAEQPENLKTEEDLTDTEKDTKGKSTSHSHSHNNYKMEDEIEPDLSAKVMKDQESIKFKNRYRSSFKYGHTYSQKETQSLVNELKSIQRELKEIRSELQSIKDEISVYMATRPELVKRAVDPNTIQSFSAPMNSSQFSNAINGLKKRNLSQETNQQHREQPAQQHREQPAQQHREQPAQQYREQPAQQHREQPAQQYREQPAQQYREQPAQQHREQPAQQYREQPAQEHREQPAQEKVNNSLKDKKDESRQINNSTDFQDYSDYSDKELNDYESDMTSLYEYNASTNNDKQSVNQTKDVQTYSNKDEINWEKVRTECCENFINIQPNRGNDTFYRSYSNMQKECLNAALNAACLGNKLTIEYLEQKETSESLSELKHDLVLDSMPFKGALLSKLARDNDLMKGVSQAALKDIIDFNLESKSVKPEEYNKAKAKVLEHNKNSITHGEQFTV